MNPLISLLSIYVLPVCVVLGMAMSTQLRAAETVAYTINPLAMGPGARQLYPWKINDRGDILAAGSDSLNRQRVFVYREGVPQELNISGDIVSPMHINNAGQILCIVFARGIHSYVLVTPEGGVVDLDTVLGYRFFPTAINDQGDMVGTTLFGNLIYNYTTGVMRSVNDDYLTSNFTAINNRGQVLGYYFSEDGTFAFGTLFTGDTYTHFRLPGRMTMTVPHFMNNKGLISGIAYDGDTFEYRPFLYEDGHFTRIGTLPGDTASFIKAINDEGEAIGESGRPGEEISRPFIYRKNKMADPNSLIPPRSGWVLETISAINNKGQIVGTGTFQGQPRSFVLNPLMAPRNGK